MSAQVRFRLLPYTKCMFDDPIQLKVAGLMSKQLVTMRASATDHKGQLFTSSATYKADDSGEVDLQKDPSLGGSFLGVEPMGLLWSMTPDSVHKRFSLVDSRNPHIVKFSVHDHVDGRRLAEVTNERLLLADGVSRLPVRKGNVQGVLFTPPGEGPFPAVLQMSTIRLENRASLLANRGFVVLSIGIFNDKPEKVTGLHLDHFEEAINFLKQHPKVGSKGVGVMSLSKSADIALSMATYLSDVEAVVFINGCSANAGHPLYYKQQLIHPALMHDIHKVVYTSTGAMMIKYGIHNHRAEENRATVIPIEKAKGHFLLVAAEDDLNWDSKAYVEELAQRLRSHGKTNFESVTYPGMGHVIEPPYGPFCPSSLHGVLGKPVLWGGEAQSHAAAEVHLWKKIQQFFRTHLTTNVARVKSKM